MRRVAAVLVLGAALAGVPNLDQWDENAQRAYDAVYAPQHNFLVRKIARGVLSFIPHRERFFVAFGTSGSDRKEWKRALKDELTSFLGALRKCNKRLQDHFATDGIPENL